MLINTFTNNIVKSIRYDSFGNIISDSNESFSLPFRFAGGIRNYVEVAGLIKNGGNTIEPGLGDIASYAYAIVGTMSGVKDLFTTGPKSSMDSLVGSVFNSDGISNSMTGKSLFQNVSNWLGL